MCVGSHTIPLPASVWSLSWPNTDRRMAKHLKARSIEQIQSAKQVNGRGWCGRNKVNSIFDMCVTLMHQFPQTTKVPAFGQGCGFAPDAFQSCLLATQSTAFHGPAQYVVQIETHMLTANRRIGKLLSRVLVLAFGAGTRSLFPKRSLEGKGYYGIFTPPLTSCRKGLGQRFHPFGDLCIW